MKLSILGGGAYGTALANFFSSKFKEVIIYAVEDCVVSDINTLNKNSLYTGDYYLDKKITATHNIDEAIEKADVILIATPSKHIESVCKKITVNTSNKLVLIASKGFCPNRFCMLSEVVSLYFPKKNVGAISGPSFAIDMLNNLPTCFSLAMEDIEEAKRLSELFTINRLSKIDPSDDIVGIQVVGALKNIVAISIGICTGMRIGNNFTSYIFTQGLAEITQVNKILGGHSETITGVSGVGDLALTCSSFKSRNFSLGFSVGKSNVYNEAQQNKLKGVAEGVIAIDIVNNIIKESSLEFTLFNIMYDIFYNGKPAKELLLEMV